VCVREKEREKEPVCVTVVYFMAFDLYVCTRVRMQDLFALHLLTKQYRVRVY